MPAPSDRVVIATITRPHGLKGSVHAKVFNPETTALSPRSTLSLATAGGESRRVRITSSQPSGDTWVLALEGVTTREQAEALRGAELWLHRSELPAPDEGEYYHVDLIGCVVRDAAGTELGTVTDVVSYPSVDALVLGDGREIPIVESIVTAVDLASRSITIDATALHEE